MQAIKLKSYEQKDQSIGPCQNVKLYNNNNKHHNAKRPTEGQEKISVVDTTNNELVASIYKELLASNQ